MDIVGIPDSIDEQVVTDFIASVGINIDDVDVEGIRLTWDTVECTVLARDADGHYYAINGEEVAMHRICIPVKHRDRTNVTA